MSGIDRGGYFTRAWPTDNRSLRDVANYSTRDGYRHRAPLGPHVLRTWDGVWYDLNDRREP